MKFAILFLGSLYGLYGLLTLIPCWFGAHGLYILHDFILNHKGIITYLVAIVALGLMCLSGLLCLGVAYSFWRTKKWGRLLAIVVAGYFMVEAIELFWMPTVERSEILDAIDALPDRYGREIASDENIRRMIIELSSSRISWIEFVLREIIGAAVIAFLLRSDVKAYMEHEEGRD